MADTSVQGFFLRTVVNWQGHPQLGDMDIAHGAGAGEVQELGVFLHSGGHGILGIAAIPDDAAPQFLIVRLGCGPGLWDCGARQRLDSILILRMNLGLVGLIVAAAEHRIDGQPQCQQEKQHRQGDGDDLSSLVPDRISSFRTAPRSIFPGGQILTGHSSFWWSEQ